MVLRIALCCSVLSAVSMGTSRGITNSLDFYHVLFILFIVAGFIDNYQLKRAVPRPNCNERGDTMKAHKKGMLGEKDRVQEAKFWVMMRKAGPGKQCLK